MHPLSDIIQQLPLNIWLHDLNLLASLKHGALNPQSYNRVS